MIPALRSLLWGQQNQWVFRLQPGTSVAALGGTFTRATTALYRDATYTWQSAGTGVQRVADHDYASGSVGTRLESQRTNSALGSCVFGGGTYYTVGGTLTVGAAATSIINGQTANLITASGGYLTQTIGTFVNAQLDCPQIFVEQGTCTVSQVTVYDGTAAAVLGTVTYTWATGVVTTSGTVTSAWANLRPGVGPNGGAVVQLWLTTAGTSTGTGKAGNARALRVYPAGASGTGVTAYLHYIGFEANATYPSSPIVTTNATVTRNADSATITLPASVTPAAIDAAGGLTVYAKVARPWHADATGALGKTPAFYKLGTVAAGSLDGLFSNGSRGLSARVYDGATPSQPSAALPAGSVLEEVAQFKNMTTAPACAIDVGSGLGSFATGSSALTAFGTQTLTVGGGLYPLDGVLIELIVAYGLQSMAYMRALA